MSETYTPLFKKGPAHVRKSRPPKSVMSLADWSAVLGAALGSFMAILDIQITNASLREIQGSLGLDFSESGWISTAYLIAEIIVIPMTGFLSEVFGIRRYIIVNTALFIVASVLCGFAWDLDSMVMFRVFQGFVGGTLIPMAFQVMLLFMPQDKKAVGMAIFGITATLAPTLGPSLGGWLTDNYGWRTNFFINVVPGALMIFLIKYGIPNGRINFEKLKKIDLSGMLTLGVGLGCLTYVLEEGAKVQWFDDKTIQICTLVSTVALAFFLAIQVLKKHPLLKLKVLLDRNFGLTAVVTMVTGCALYGGIYALSLYLGQIQNYSAMDVGQVMMWVGIPQLAVMPLMPFLMKKFNLKFLIVVGMLMFAGSNFLNSHLDFNYAGEQFRWSLIVRALGQPLFMIPLSTIGMALIPAYEAGNAASIFNMMRNLGGSIGIAMTSTLVVSKQNQHFYNYMEHLAAADTRLVERLNGVELLLRQKGLDIVAAKAQALKLMLGMVQRDAFIQSFSDVFFLLTLGLVICTVLVMFLRPVRNVSLNMDSME